jgi:hypothetical protein
MSRYDHIDFSPPNSVQRAAQLGLELRRTYGRGGTAVGVARAVQLSSGRNVSPQTARRMLSYFLRHERDLDAPAAQEWHQSYPSAGVIAWLLWGGDPGRDWAAKLADQMWIADGEQ